MQLFIRTIFLANLFCASVFLSATGNATLNSLSHVEALLETHSFENVKKAKLAFDRLDLDESEWKFLLGEKKKEPFQTIKEAVGVAVFYPSETREGFFRAPSVLLRDVVVALRIAYAAFYKSPNSLILSSQLASIFSLDEGEGDVLADELRKFGEGFFEWFSVPDSYKFMHEKIIDDAEKKRRSGKASAAYALLKRVEGYAPEINLTIARYAMQYYAKGIITEEEFYDSVRKGNRPGFAYVSFALGEKTLVASPQIALRLLMIGLKEFGDLKCAQLIRNNLCISSLPRAELEKVEESIIIYESLREDIAHALHEITKTTF